MQNSKRRLTQDAYFGNRVFSDAAEADADGQYLCEGARSRDGQGVGLSFKELSLVFQ